MCELQSKNVADFLLRHGVFCNEWSLSERLVQQVKSPGTFIALNSWLFRGMEALIRAKYELKKYIDKDWQPPQLSSVSCIHSYLLNILALSRWFSTPYVSGSRRIDPLFPGRMV